MNPFYKPFLGAAAVCVLLAGCGEEQHAAPTPPRPARVTVVSPNKLGLVAQGAGRIQPRYESRVGFEVGGRLISRDVDVGALVRKGQKLAQLNPTDYQNKVAAAEAELTAAKAAVDQAGPQERRYSILLDKGFTTRSVYEGSVKVLQSAEAQLQAAEANLRLAKDQLGYTELLAPDDGVVTATQADPGQVVSAGQTVLVLSRNAEREAVFAVASEHVARAKLNMPVRVWLQGREDVWATGFVRQIAPEADSATGTYEVRVALPAPLPEMRLGAVVVGQAVTEGQEVTTLPSTALLQTGDKPQVWVVGGGGKVERRSVEIFEFGAAAVSIKSGLAAGETVVTAGVNSLADGQVVKPVQEVN